MLVTMNLDLLAGTVLPRAPAPVGRPTILVFDSGLGGLTVFAELRRARPDARFVYAADDAAFPYGALSEGDLVARILLVMGRLIDRHAPDLVVVACNTASTLVLPYLRRRFDLPFVGTVPAIKPAASLSRSRRFTVLATPGTVARDYTRELVGAYAGDCRVDLVGSPALAALAEAELSADPAPDAAILAEIAPCFVQDGNGRTDVVVLACTHYPLLRARFEELAPWPVAWLDPAPAVARRVADIVGVPQPTTGAAASDGSDHLAVFTGTARPGAALAAACAARGLGRIVLDPMPLRAREH